MASVPGDVNSDGVVNGEDAALAANHILDKGLLTNPAPADANQDGVLDAADVGWIAVNPHELTQTPTPTVPPTATPTPTPTAIPTPGGETFTLILPGNVPLELVRIPAGSFVMGSPTTERGRVSAEGPQTNVTISQAFYMGKYELTQRQWRAILGTNPSYFTKDTHPVDSVSWSQAQSFLTALNTHITTTGQGPLSMRLPTEAQWEYACRAGTSTRFSFGNSLDCTDDCSDCPAGTLSGKRTDYMWYCGNNALSDQPGFGTKSVGQKKPNAFGLYDMHGNVWEWCQDWYAYSLPGGNVTDPTGPTTAWDRVLRGGSWDFRATDCRSACRFYYPPGNQLRNLGFRVVGVMQASPGAD